MGKDQFGRDLFDVVCSKCGKDTQVPFKPTEGKPVYCRDCYKPKRRF
ncbi:MAG: CxxC-x17-CxxC domain-containing protein [Methanobacteriota archaeon]